MQVNPCMLTLKTEPSQSSITCLFGFSHRHHIFASLHFGQLQCAPRLLSCNGPGTMVSWIWCPNPQWDSIPQAVYLGSPSHYEIPGSFGGLRNNWLPQSHIESSCLPALRWLAPCAPYKCLWTEAQWWGSPYCNRLAVRDWLMCPSGMSLRSNGARGWLTWHVRQPWAGAHSQTCLTRMTSDGVA